MRRRTTLWALRLAAASFGAALLFTGGPGSSLDGAAYAKSGGDKKQAETAKASKPAKPAKPAPRLTRPGAASRPSKPATSAKPAPSSRGSSPLGRVQIGRGEISRPSRPSTTPAPGPSARPRSDPPRAETSRGLGRTLPWRRDAAPSPVARPSPTSPPSSTPSAESDRRPGGVLPWRRDAAPGRIARPELDDGNRPGPSGPGRSGSDTARITRPSGGRQAVRIDSHPAPHSPLIRPRPDANLPREPAVVPADEQRQIGPAHTILRRPGRDGREVVARPFERLDRPRVDDSRRLLSPVPRRESYFHRIWDRHPAEVGRPLHISYFTALHRYQARRYYRAYYYQCAPYYYPYDYWYVDYYVNYYHPWYYRRPYVVISFPIFIERYHTVGCCPRYDGGVWYYYDRPGEGYDHKYPYLTNYPGTLGRALRDIQQAWYEEEIGYLVSHVDEWEAIRIYRGDEYTHDLGASEFLDLTLDAFDQTETDYLQYTDIQRIRGGAWARARAKHVFWDADGDVRTVYLSYYLERVADRDGDEWVLREIRQDSRPF